MSRFVRPPAHPLHAVTAFASLVTGAALATACGDGDGLPAVDAPTSPRIEVHATEMSFDPTAIAVRAGDVEVVLHNDGAALHDLRIEDQPFILEAGPGQTAADRVTLEPGRYAIFCSLPGHREAGMEGVLEVR